MAKIQQSFTLSVLWCIVRVSFWCILHAFVCSD